MRNAIVVVLLRVVGSPLHVLSSGKRPLLRRRLIDCGRRSPCDRRPRFGTGSLVGLRIWHSRGPPPSRRVPRATCRFHDGWGSGRRRYVVGRRRRVGSAADPRVLSTPNAGTGRRVTSFCQAHRWLASATAGSLGLAYCHKQAFEQSERQVRLAARRAPYYRRQPNLTMSH